MHKPLFRIAVGSVAAVGGLIAASALPAGAATSVRAETMATAPTCPTTGDGAIINGSATANSAGDCGNTTVTFTVSSVGVLAITAPTANVDLGTGSTHNVSGTGTPTVIGFAGNFGPVTVTDLRALDPATWTATVYSSDFVNSVTTGGTTTTDTIHAADATYDTGIVAVTPTCITVDQVNCQDLATGPILGSSATSLTDVSTAPAAPITLANGPTGQPVVTEAAFDGDNSTQWTPTIDINVPADAVAGAYTGTVTHSVS